MSNLLINLIGKRYVFFNSLSQSEVKQLRYAYKYAVGRISKISSLLGDNNDSNIKTPESERFNQFMTSYIAQLESIAASLRANEISYIESIAATSKDLLTSKMKRFLNNLKSGNGVSESDYQEIITILNKIQYRNDMSKFKEIINEQIDNMTALEQNLNMLKEQHGDEYDKLQEDYLYRYGNYVNNYIDTMKTYFKDEYKRKKTTKIQSLANKINGVLNKLASEPDIEPLIAKIWQDHPNDTSVVITEGDAFNQIIELAIEKVLAATDGEGPATIAKEIITSINNNSIKFKDLESLQAYKVVTKKNTTGKTLEQVLNDSRQILIKVLLQTNNLDEVLSSFFSNDEPEKIEKIKNQIQRLRKKSEAISNSRDYNKFLRNYKDTETDSKSLEEQLRDELKNTSHFQRIKSLLATQSFSTIRKDKNNNIIDLDQLQNSIRNNFSIRINKSGLAELLARNKADLEHMIFNDVQGNTLNMKDDVFCAFHVAAHDIKSLEQDIDKDEELQQYLDQIDSTVKTYFRDFIKKYSSPSSNKKRGVTDTGAAIAQYTDAMLQVYNQYKQIKTENADLFKKLSEQMEANSIFLESISVKEYDLYNNDIGFHAGTLGPNTSKILDNIWQMYRAGGINILDVEAIEFGLINCSQNAVGAGLKKSLEHYLLGGAALMVFDEGAGSAIKYLNNMEKDIKAILPKNLNLYFLNQTYVPASYILETICNNLKLFYNYEITNNAETFKERNKVIITNNAVEPDSYGDDIIASFQSIADETWNNINIQFVFMAGMLDIFSNLGKAFNIKK